MSRSAVLVCVLCALPAALAVAESVDWERTPIPVTLAVGVERQIRFEGPATVGAPAELIEGGALRAQFANDTAYWLATEPFEARRLKVRLERTGEFVLFDVRAVVGGMGTAEPLEVRVARPEQGYEAGADNARTDDPRGALVELVRYAARRELAPPRLAGEVAGVVAVETATTDATGLYEHADRERLRLGVVGQWSRAGLFVTTLEAINGSPEPLELDVRRLRRGPRSGVSEGFVAVAWTRSRLAPAGEAGFTARLHLVTREPFDLAAAAP